MWGSFWAPGRWALRSPAISEAGQGIRTLDFDLGKVVPASRFPLFSQGSAAVRLRLASCRSHRIGFKVGIQVGIDARGSGVSRAPTGPTGEDHELALLTPAGRGPGATLPRGRTGAPRADRPGLRAHRGDRPRARRGPEAGHGPPGSRGGRPGMGPRGDRPVLRARDVDALRGSGPSRVPVGAVPAPEVSNARPRQPMSRDDRLRLGRDRSLQPRVGRWIPRSVRARRGPHRADGGLQDFG